MGFREFLEPEVTTSRVTGDDGLERSGASVPASSRRRLRRQSTLNAWQEFSERLGHDTMRQFLSHSADHLYGLYSDLQQSEAPAQLIHRFENLMESLVSDARQLERERQKFEQTMRREREQHQTHLKNLEDELEMHVQRVAQVVKNEAEAKCQTEKKILQDNLETEIAQLQTHLRLFQKVKKPTQQSGAYSLRHMLSFYRCLFLLFRSVQVENWLQREQQEVQTRDQQETVQRTSSENRQLKLSLVDAQTTLALLQTELAQLKSQFVQKDRLLLR